MKTRIYAAPAVKGLTRFRSIYANAESLRVDLPFSVFFREGVAILVIFGFYA